MHMTVYAWWQRVGPSHSACKKQAWWQYVCMHAVSLVLMYQNSSPPPKLCSSGSPPTIFSHRDLISHPRLQRKCGNWNSNQRQVTPSVSGRRSQRWKRCIHCIPHDCCKKEFGWGWEKYIFLKTSNFFLSPYCQPAMQAGMLSKFKNDLDLSNVYICKEPVESIWKWKAKLGSCKGWH